MHRCKNYDLVIVVQISARQIRLDILIELPDGLPLKDLQIWFRRRTFQLNLTAGSGSIHSKVEYSKT